MFFVRHFQLHSQKTGDDGLLVRPRQGFEIQREVTKIGPEKELGSSF
jgi:hypothetical protein